MSSMISSPGIATTVIVRASLVLIQWRRVACPAAAPTRRKLICTPESETRLACILGAIHWSGCKLIRLFGTVLRCL